MALEFITGFLLVLAMLGVLVYIFKELFSSVRLDFSKVSLSDALGRQRNTEPAPINEHLIGMTGEVVRHTDDSERPMRIRLASEFWPARSAPADTPESAIGLPPVGTTVVVTAVEGPVVIVRPA